MIPPLIPAVRQAVETILNDQWPGEWRLAQDGERVPTSEAGNVCWRLDASPGEHGHESVDFVWLCIDGDFPLSRVRIYAPGANAPGAPAWPHVEDLERLCLGPLPLNIESHVRFAVQDAFSILGMDEAQRTQEFAREFVPYWDRKVGSIPEARSLIMPGGLNRPIVWAPFGKSYLFAEDIPSIKHWYTQTGYRLDVIHHTRLLRLESAPSPDNYPSIGADIFAIDPLVRDLCQTRDPLPVLLEVPTPGGAVQVGAVITPSRLAGLGKNLKQPVRNQKRDAVFGPAPISRISVMRQDHAWVHGRDHNDRAEQMSQMVAGIIGCGALGSEVARQLAAAGIGQLVLIDKDRLESANTTRHALGATSVGKLKASALAKALGQQFPHLHEAVVHDKAFESLEEDALSQLASCNLIVAAGVEALTIVRIARWRDGLDAPPPLIVSWTEEFACVGHAMLLSPGLTVETFLDNDRRPKVNLTSNWTDASIIPAGCSSAFQPYTATDMLGTVQMTARLSLDALFAQAHAPVHRIWLGDRRIPEQHGATISSGFDAAFREIEAP